ncbi:hypothetical protein SEVIR_8G108400v4 [Setaria viridis]
MDKRMHVSEELGMADSSANQESHGEEFIRRVASSGMIVKFKVDKYGTFSSESTIPLQEVRSSDRENASDPFDNFEINSDRNVIPSLGQPQITNMESSGEISILENVKMANLDQGINRAVMVGNSTTVIAVDNAAIGINETSSSGNAKMDNMENVIAVKSSPENLLVRATENGSGSGSDMHICDQCGKSFEKIGSLHGHMGSHGREGYKHMRMMAEQPIPVDASQPTVVSLPVPKKKKKRKLKHILEPSRALVEMSMAPVCHPKFGTATTDLSASVTFSSDAHSSGETAETREVAEFLTTLVERIRKDTVKVPSPPATEGFVCCNKTFYSTHALGGHMSIHNKRKNTLLEDGSAGSSSGSGQRCTSKHVCSKCNKSFPTGQSLGGHKRKHYYEEYKMISPADGNMKPPIPLPHETVPSSVLAVLPTVENMKPPVLLASDNMKPRMMHGGKYHCPSAATTGF